MITLESISQCGHFDIQPDNKNTIQLTFPLKTLSIPQDLKEGDYCYLRVRNINLNLFKISYNLNDINDSTVTSSLELPMFKLIGFDNLTSFLNKAAPSAITTTLITKSLNDYLLYNREIAKGKEKEKDPLTERINGQLKFMNETVNKIIDIERLIDDLFKKSSSLELSFLTLHPDISNELNGSFSLNELIIEANSYRDMLNKTMNVVNDSSFALSNLMTDEMDDSLLSDLYSKYNELKSSINKIYSAISADQISNLIKSIIRLQNNVDNTSESNSGSDYISIPFRLDSDCPKLSIDIVPRITEFGLPDYHSGDIFLIRPSNYIGIGACFYISGLYNRIYSLQESFNGADTVFTTVNEKPNHFEIGIASLFHFGWNFGKSHFGGHVVMGPALSLSTPAKLRLAFGGGLSYGEKQRLSLNLLIIGGYVDRGSKKTNITKAEELTVSKLQMSCGLSVGYIYKF